MNRIYIKRITICLILFAYIFYVDSNSPSLSQMRQPLEFHNKTLNNCSLLPSEKGALIINNLKNHISRHKGKKTSRQLNRYVRLGAFIRYLGIWVLPFKSNNINYKKIDSLSEKYKEEISAVKNPVRLDLIIDGQSGEEYNEAVELGSNGMDATIAFALKNLSLDKKKKVLLRGKFSGKFGEGSMQSYKPGEDVIINTRIKNRPYNRVVKIERRKNRVYMRDYKKDKQRYGSSGTTITVVKKKWRSADKLKFKEKIRKKFKGNRVMRVFIEDYKKLKEEVNRLRGFKNIAGDYVSHLIPRKKLIYFITRYGYQVMDFGTGMSDKVLYEKYLLPHQSTNKQYDY